jgi:hypothetical protein
MFAKVFKCFFKCFQKHVASVCFKYFNCFQTYVACVLFECCICCSGYNHMLQAYVPNVSSVLDICCSKSSMLQVFHETQAVPTGEGRSRASRRRRATWHRQATRAQTSSRGHGQATAGRGEQQGRHACFDARPWVGATWGSAWETITWHGTCRRCRGAGALPFSAVPFWPLAGTTDNRGSCAPLAIRPHVCECAGMNALHGPHGRASAGLSGGRVAGIRTRASVRALGRPMLIWPRTLRVTNLH